MADGFDPDRFWLQTPASFAGARRGAGIRATREGKRDVSLAYTIGKFVNADPKLLKPLPWYLRDADDAASSGSMLEKFKRRFPNARRVK